MPLLAQREVERHGSPLITNPAKDTMKPQTESRAESYPDRQSRTRKARALQREAEQAIANAMNARHDGIRAAYRLAVDRLPRRRPAVFVDGHSLEVTRCPS